MFGKERWPSMPGTKDDPQSHSVAHHAPYAHTPACTFPATPSSAALAARYVRRLPTVVPTHACRPRLASSYKCELRAASPSPRASRCLRPQPTATD
jgi:hypothetical protein